MFTGVARILVWGGQQHKKLQKRTHLGKTYIFYVLKILIGGGHVPPVPPSGYASEYVTHNKRNEISVTFQLFFYKNT